MTRRVCLAIGVGTVAPPQDEASRFAHLDGAIVSVRAIGQWALSTEFGAENVRVIDDGRVEGVARPVTRERVQTAVNELFPTGAEPVRHLLLAFCGHGLTDPNIGAISWLFTDSLQSKYRVVADRFYAELQLHGVGRITLISDACREGPKDIELLRLDAVRGIVVNKSNAVPSPKFDRLAACQDGQLAYMVSEPMSALPGKCVFSGVVADALCGIEPSAIQGGLITTASLGECVSVRTSERARDYRLRLDPECVVSPPGVVLRDATAPLPQPVPLQPWPAAGVVAILGTAAPHTGATDIDHHLERISTDEQFRSQILGADFSLTRHAIAVPEGRPFTIPARSKDLFRDLMTLRSAPLDNASRAMAGSLVQRLEGAVAADVQQQAAAQVLRSFRTFEDLEGANLTIEGDVARIWSCPPVTLVNRTSAGARFRVQADFSGMPVLVELRDGRFVPVVPYEQLFAVVATSATGDVFQAYGASGVRDSYRDAIRLIADFASGRLGADQIPHVAARLRHEKHADPALGVICAHLYRLVADYDNIRRMAFFFAINGQPVPFDIALLGQMRVTRDRGGMPVLQVPAVPATVSDANAEGLPGFTTQETSAVKCRIAGRCPWLGLGWDHVQDLRPETTRLVSRRLARIAGAVRRSGSTVLLNEAGHSLAKLWRMKPTWR